MQNEMSIDDWTDAELSASTMLVIVEKPHSNF